MIMTVEKLRSYIDTEESDDILKVRLAAIEQLIRRKTNNNFQSRAFRVQCDTDESGFLCESPLFAAGDTVEVSHSALNAGLYTLTKVGDGCMKTEESMYAEKDVLVTKVVYPLDIRIGAVNMLKWDLTHRDKTGIASESISRHSVSYVNMESGTSTIDGYPSSLMGFMKTYMKARF